MSTVALVGPGAVGLTFAFAARQAGHDVIVCARSGPPTGGYTVAREGAAPAALDATVLTDPAQVEHAADWVFLAVKAHQTAGAAAWLDALCRPRTNVLALRNGVEHRPGVEPYVNGAIVLPAVIWLPAETPARGAVVTRGAWRLAVPDDPPGRALETLLHGSDAEVELEDDFLTHAWRKLVLNAVAGLLVLTLRRMEVFADPGIRELARAYAAEAFAVAAADGATLAGDEVDALMARIDAMPGDQTTSMLADRLAGRELEWEARNGVIARLGARQGVPTPIADVINPILAASGPPPP